MGGNGRVMSALPSHRGKMHQKMSPKRKLQYQSQIHLQMKMRRYISMCYDPDFVLYISECICNKGVVDATEKLIGQEEAGRLNCLVHFYL